MCTVTKNDSALTFESKAQETAMVLFAKDIQRKCSLLSICESLVKNDFSKLYCIDDEINERLESLSEEDKQELKAILLNMIGQ